MMVIINPTARGYYDGIDPQLRRLLGKEFDLKLETTTGPEHATELAEQAARNGFDIVVAAGGNGTCNKVINGLMIPLRDGIAATFGIIPIGSGNELANTLGITQVEEACRLLIRGKTRLLDVGQVTLPDRRILFFGNTAGIGLDGRIAFDLEKPEVRNAHGLKAMLVYLKIALKAVTFYNRAPITKIEWDGGTIVQPLLMIVAANGPKEGGFFLVAPQAELDDGFFDLLLVSKISGLQILELIPRFLKGAQAGKESVTLVRTEHARVSSEAKLFAHIDGEVLCTDSYELKFKILPQQLQVIC